MPRSQHRWVFIFLFTLAGLTALALASPHELLAQNKFQSIYEVRTDAKAVGGNYVKARKKALNAAMRLALEESIKNIIGPEEYEVGPARFRSLLVNAAYYVHSYRYLDAYDNLEAGTSEVNVEVTLYSQALRQKLSAMGIFSGIAKPRSVAILINEKGLADSDYIPFWDLAPVSEGFMIKFFQEAEILIVRRQDIGDAIQSKNLLKAAQGDIGAAVSIGSQTGANIVIVGSAVTRPLGDLAQPGPKTIQVSLSLKAISAMESKVVAAKSEFATARALNGRQAESEAYEKASRKLSGFFLSSIRRFWEPKVAQPGAPVSKPTPQPGTPGFMEDM